MPNDVATWLKSSRDYNTGLELLRRYGATKFILTLLQTGPGPFNTPKLLEEVTKLTGVSQNPAMLPGDDHRSRNSAMLAATDLPSQKPAIPAVSGTASQDHAIGYPNHNKPDHNLEKQLRVKKQISDLFKELTHIRAKLINLPEGEQLFQCAKAVITKDLKRQDLWQHLHYFEANGKWFDEQPENQVKELDDDNPADLEKKIKNLMASRSKVTAILKQPWPPAMQQHHERRLANFNKEIDQLKAKRK